ncbi:hypothetical protein G7A66_13365 [Altererythrobacter sp. SALINAS58]|uniref:hypothetical protein n=1 Tax=Alteripontixanthobacter muriae TaxID=2705546 RepID=UPI0015773C86|nr:hypothetical protein [Alteripontixanthobacter muriae]NTZ44049.1 hypothetical protein [Alteripontixanthobacter muriae]
MTNDDEDQSMAAIELCRKINRSAAAKFHERGICPEDVAIGCLYSTLDVAMELKGGPVAAIEWLRTGLDVLERDAMAGQRRAH